jgi:integrase
VRGHPQTSDTYGQAARSIAEGAKEKSHLSHAYQQFVLLSKYSEQISQYLEVFPKEQVKIFIYEEISAERKKFILDVCAFLGIRYLYDNDFEHRTNTYNEPKGSLLKRLYASKIVRRTIKTVLTKKQLERVNKTFFDNKKLSEAVSEPLWTQYCNQAPVSDLTNHRKVFAHFLSWCKQQGFIRYVPEFKIPEVERRERRVLKPHEIKAVLTAAEPGSDILLFTSLYLFMGMRASESLKLSWDRVNFTAGAIALERKHTKTRRARGIKINVFVYNLLRQRKTEQEAKRIKTPWVFPVSTDPKRAKIKSSMRKPWLMLLKRAGLQGEDITPHDLRATFEYFANKRSDFTDAQREKFAGASITVQKNIYIDFDAEDVAGLEQVVEVEGLNAILESKI